MADPKDTLGAKHGDPLSIDEWLYATPKEVADAILNKKIPPEKVKDVYMARMAKNQEDERLRKLRNLTYGNTSTNVYSPNEYSSIKQMMKSVGGNNE